MPHALNEIWHVDTTLNRLIDGSRAYLQAVVEVVESGLLTRVLAQTEITFSNSLIESWWRVLKHRLNSSELLRNSDARPPFSELDTVSDENSRVKLHNVLANSCAE